jgi:hypothetical protein
MVLHEVEDAPWRETGTQGPLLVVAGEQRHGIGRERRQPGLGHGWRPTVRDESAALAMQ